jgi:hypothetical protein
LGVALLTVVAAVKGYHSGDCRLPATISNPNRTHDSRIVRLLKCHKTNSESERGRISKLILTELADPTKWLTRSHPPSEIADVTSIDIFVEFGLGLRIAVRTAARQRGSAQ